MENKIYEKQFDELCTKNKIEIDKKGYDKLKSLDIDEYFKPLILQVQDFIKSGDIDVVLIVGDIKIYAKKEEPQKEIKKAENPFKKLHYTTQHLTCFNEFNFILGLYGKQYLPIKKARWYQLIGGILQKKITLGDKYTDTRINCIFPLPTEQGKNDIIYVFKNVLSQVKKSKEYNFVIEEPVSYHPEQLIGKVVEIMIDNPSGTKPKKIMVKKENRGFFNADFVEIDEANSLIFSKDEQLHQAREYISKALNPIDRNEVVKKLVEDLPTERVAYCPKCTFTLYFQPSGKIKEELFLQGFLRRFLIPVGNIEPFLNYGNEEDFRRKISVQEFSKQEVKEKLIGYLEKVRENIRDRDFVFTQEANEKINFYLQYLLAEGQIHSEKIANLTKLMKWTIQDYLIKMSCCLAGSFYQNIVDEKIVALAYMDLVELLQSTFDFIKEWVIGNFDYGAGWQGANYKERICLEYLYENKCFSLETSNIGISEFWDIISNVYNVKGDMARKIYSNFKKNEWINSKQIDRYDTRVWLGFIPQIENLTFQGDKGRKGVNIYESIFSAINSVLSSVSPLSPFTPSTQETLNIQTEKINSEPEAEENAT